MALLLGLNAVFVQGFALVFAILAVIIAYFISLVYGHRSTLILVLAGVIISNLFSALISLVKFVADPLDTLPAIVFWLMGSLAAVGTKEVLTIAPIVLPGMILLLLFRWRLNVLSLGEMESKSLGISPRKNQTIIVGATTLVTAAVTCISGIVGWVGLIIPHLSRIITGPDHGNLLPGSAILGAIFLLIVDNIARTATGAEIPLGILTSIVGTPFFAWLIVKRKVNWS